MRGVAWWFIVSAVVYVLAGMAFGIYMSIIQDHSLASAHAHLNLIGWVSMAIFGIYYHLVPSASEGRLAKVHFIVATLTVWIMVPGIVMAIRGDGEELAKVGSLLGVATMLVFLMVVLRNRLQAVVSHVR